MTQEQLTAQVVIVGLTRYVSMVSVLPYRHAAVDAPRDQRVLMEYVFLIIHVAVDVPMGKHESTEYATPNDPCANCSPGEICVIGTCQPDPCADCEEDGICINGECRPAGGDEDIGQVESF